MPDDLKSFLEHIIHLNKVFNSIDYKATFYCLSAQDKSAIMVGRDSARISRQLSYSATSKLTLNGFVKLRDKNGRRTKTGYVVKIEQ